MSGDAAGVAAAGVLRLGRCAGDRVAVRDVIGRRDVPPLVEVDDRSDRALRARDGELQDRSWRSAAGCNYRRRRRSQIPCRDGRARRRVVDRSSALPVFGSTMRLMRMPSGRFSSTQPAARLVDVALVERACPRGGAIEMKSRRPVDDAAKPLPVRILHRRRVHLVVVTRVRLVMYAAAGWTDPRPRACGQIHRRRRIELPRQDVVAPQLRSADRHMV